MSKITAQLPFPQQEEFFGTIKPTIASQAEMNSSITEFYNFWKKEYLKKNNESTSYDGYLIEMQGTGGTGEEKTTSEAHGYGMIIFALMAGYDDDAKEYFDGMFNVFNKNRSTINNNLMSWIISRDEDKAKNSNSATDGDLDIAYSLLLADKQWGSDGDINYIFEAQQMITEGIKKSLIDDLNRVRLGDWANIDGYHYTTRPSDWMLSHFQAFSFATLDDFWTTLINDTEKNITYLQDKYSPKTGLMPDFVVGSVPKPASPNFLEDEHDGHYNWNACRTPWRFSLDYIHNYNTQAKEYVCKMLDWIIDKTAGDFTEIYNGYTLEGEEINKIEWNRTTAFTAPFVTAAMVDEKYQDFLNNGWEFLKENRSGAYFDRTINLMNMLIISGNWWKPNF